MLEAEKELTVGASEAVYISLECMRKADLLTKGAALGMSHVDEKSDPTLEFAEDSHLLACLSARTKCQQKALSV